MPEQKSVFTITEIKSILKVEYNISVSDMSALGHGSANCFCISDDFFGKNASCSMGNHAFLCTVNRFV